MCTVYDDDDDLLMTSEDLPRKPEKSCRNCENPAKVCLRKKDAYCKNCFLTSATHKFRAALGKSKIVKASDRVLVVFSDCHSSVALLHMLYTGFNEAANKKLMFSADVLFIDDGVILGKTTKERENVINQVMEKSKFFGFKLIVKNLSIIFCEKECNHDYQCSIECHEEKLRVVFENVKSMTAKEDLLHRLKNKLIVKVAQDMKYEKVFTAEVATSLAIKLLTGMSLGRGDQISAEVGFYDDRNSKVTILRPLKDFTLKEIIFYNIFNHIDLVNIPTLTTMSPVGISIQKTAENFINELQERFPSTVYTVFRTGDKFKMNECNACSGKKTCLLCSTVIENTNTNYYDAIQALNFSKKVSESLTSKIDDKLNKFLDNKDCCVECSCSKMSNVVPDFCYGCSLILKNMDNREKFHNWIIKFTTKERNIQMLKKQISEFLIE